jgi:phosphatidylserine decarboxylase
MSDPFIAFQNALPKHLLTRFVGRLATSKSALVRDPFIRLFARAYGVDLAEAVVPAPGFASFNEFFTRALVPGARPIDPDPAVFVCPCDGTISQRGTITAGTLLQAKGTSYALESLAGGLAKGFEAGLFVTIYLAPHDYHRVHAPDNLRLTASEAVPGDLFSVNARTEASVADLFCRNERLVCRFGSPHGDVLMVLVGALIVGAIETVWGSPPSPYRERRFERHDHAIARGAELGRFLLGSTVILCLPPGRAELLARLEPGARVRMGEALGRWRS